MQQLVLASNNAGKLAELGQLFAGIGWELLPQKAFDVPEAPEPHCTFVENALAKARNAAQHTGLPAVADDAGLMVDAFNGLPGVDTAHYCEQFGYPKSNENNVRALLEQMLDVAPEQRGAAMVSTLVAVRYPNDPQPLIASGITRGRITTERTGDGGFGYDPVFYVPEKQCTFAQLSDAQKNALSHRGKAAREMLRLMQQAW